MSRCGFIAVVGRPNVGKSTLINALVGEKVSITANKPQTTRHAIYGVLTEGENQLCFVDTPGIHRGGAKALNRTLNRSAMGQLAGVDVIVQVLRAMRWTEEDAWVANTLAKQSAPVVLAVNMLDRVRDKAELLGYLSQLPTAAAVIPISAIKGQYLEALKQELILRLPEQDFLFDPELYTDRSQRFIAAELIREQATRLLEKELPYSLTVEVERFDEKQGRLYIHGLIWVEREGQKGIVIGQRGAQLKRIGTLAREAMEYQFGQQVVLKLWVKVRKDWSDNATALQSLGYKDP